MVTRSMLALALLAACGPPAPSARVERVVDALVWSEQQKLLPSNSQDSQNFGTAVAIAGDTAVVGAPEDDDGGTDAGALYVFERNDTGWSEQEKIAASAAGELFGDPLAMEGDTLVVGAATADNGAGAVYVFVRSGTSFVEEQRLTASDAQEGDAFGRSVDISADSLVVGANNATSSLGAAYVFVRSGTVWSEQQKLTASDGQPQDQFGIAVAIAGDTLVAGSTGASVASVARAGAAYAFVRSGSTWSQQQKLVASNPQPNEEIGQAVALDADTALIGAPKANTNTGRVSVFTRSGSTWSEAAPLAASDAEMGDAFGFVVAMAGDVAVVGVPEDDTPASGAGSAYVFRRAGNAWNEEQRIDAADGATLDYFGDAVALDGDTVVAGAPFDDIGAIFQAGSAYAFVLLGGACTDGSACGSAHCVDGVCCAQRACGPCGRCNLAGAEGNCGPVPLGDPGDGSCAPYACDGASEMCPRSCSDDVECSEGAGCDATGHCVPLGELAASCASDDECASGHCSDGVCCDAVCGDACDRCDLSGHEGTCTIVDCGG
ncbi:MAG TPA: FG-GAP repeat protein, partial [Polyangiaceae bacterium]|nr:FG-GAP repeat protein [Polyangiaceae bacterium]